ncbi:MAG: hypothetical protein ACOCQX_03380 [Candidatus Nanoarchaeia archaeon]
MIYEPKLKRSFQKVKEDMQGINCKINHTTNNLNEFKTNTQEWLLHLMNRQNQLEEKLNIIITKLNELENSKINVARH